MSVNVRHNTEGFTKCHFKEVLPVTWEQDLFPRLQNVAKRLGAENNSVTIVILQTVEGDAQFCLFQATS